MTSVNQVPYQKKKKKEDKKKILRAPPKTHTHTHCTLRLFHSPKPFPFLSLPNSNSQTFSLFSPNANRLYHNIAIIWYSKHLRGFCLLAIRMTVNIETLLTYYTIFEVTHWQNLQGWRIPVWRSSPLDIMYSRSLMHWENRMVSMAKPKFKQKQKRTDNKFVFLTGPITCSDHAEQVAMFI